MIARYCLNLLLYAAFTSSMSAADLIIRFDEDVSRLSVRLYANKPTTAKVVSLDDQADPNPATYPNITDQGKVATFSNIPPGSCWVTIEDSNSSWDRNYIDVREINKLDSNQQIEWDIPDGSIDVMFRGENSHIIVKLERSIGGELDEVFQKWLILERDKANLFSGKFTRVGKGVYLVSFFEYSPHKGIGSLICSCSATRNTRNHPSTDQLHETDKIPSNEKDNNPLDPEGK